jgi:hypothetical protein
MILYDFIYIYHSYIYIYYPQHMKIVINSHIKSEIALVHLLESMTIQKEFIDYDVVVIIGGYYNNNGYEIEKKDNITYIKCNYNSIDLTGLIALMELYYDNDNEHYFYLHDTCKVGNNFYKKLKSIDLTKISSIKINKNFSMNIGIYSQIIINNFKDFLLSRKNLDENRLIEFKLIGVGEEDYIFKHDYNNQILENYNGNNYTGPIDYYNTGTMRRVEYYPNIDLYKIKANWGQGVFTLKN